MYNYHIFQIVISMRGNQPAQVRRLIPAYAVRIQQNSFSHDFAPIYFILIAFL